MYSCKQNKKSETLLKNYKMLSKRLCIILQQYIVFTQRRRKYSVIASVLEKASVGELAEIKVITQFQGIIAILKT